MTLTADSASVTIGTITYTAPNLWSAAWTWTAATGNAVGVVFTAKQVDAAGNETLKQLTVV